MGVAGLRKHPGGWIKPKYISRWVVSERSCACGERWVEKKLEGAESPTSCPKCMKEKENVSDE